jgi:hypothetical protein
LLPFLGSSLCCFKADLDIFDHTEDVAFFQHQQVLSLNFDLGSGPFPDQDPVTWSDARRVQFIASAPRTRSDGDHLTLLQLFPSPIGNDPSARRLLIGINAFDQHTIVKGLDRHSPCGRPNQPFLG